MKKAVLLAVVGLLSFALGTAGIYLAMPRLSPGTHDSTRIRLDSLGLLARSANTISQLALLPDSLRPDSTNLTDSSMTADVPPQPTPQNIIQSLRDSLERMNNLVLNLQSDTTTYISDIASLSKQIDAMNAERADAEELSKSLSKLEDKQLSSILSGLELGIIELIYSRSSARERTRLLQSMPPDQAARFVRTLVAGPPPKDDAQAAEDDDNPEAQDAEGQTSNQ